MKRYANSFPLLAILLTTACSSASGLRCDDLNSRPPRNWDVVEEARVYRGGQLETCGQLDYLRSIGVKNILKLNDEGRPIDRDEEQHATAAGLGVRSFHFEAGTIGTAATCAMVREAFAFLTDDQNWPVYVHCTAGKDRTGYLIGLYEKLILHKPAAEVLAELHAHGHRGARATLFAQIDRELAKDVPECAK